MKSCPECGADVASGADACEACGADLAAVPVVGVVSGTGGS